MEIGASGRLPFTPCAECALCCFWVSVRKFGNFSAFFRTLSRFPCNFELKTAH